MPWPVAGEGRPQGRPYVRAVIADSHQFDAAFYLDATTGKGFGEHLLDVHLPDERHVREGGIRQLQVAEADSSHPPAQPEVYRGRGLSPGQERLSHAERTQYFERASMQDQRAGGPERLRPPLDDADVAAVGVGLQGQGQSGWPPAGHQDAGRATHEISTGRHHSKPSAARGRSLRCRPGSTW